MNFDLSEEQQMFVTSVERFAAPVDVEARRRLRLSPTGYDLKRWQDLAEMGRQAFSNPALLKLQRVNPKIQRLRAEMENEALTPEEDATIGKLIQDIFARRFPQ